jgi:uncharacterized protein (TIGR03067 family)
MRRLTLPLALALLSLSFAPAPLPKPGPKDKDLKGLQGTWVGPGDLVARFEGDTLRYYRGGELVRSYHITVNPLARPKQMDLVGIGADKGLRYYYVYDLDGDTLKTSSNGWDEPRPTAFQGKGRGRAVESFQRKKQ